MPEPLTAASTSLKDLDPSFLLTPRQAHGRAGPDIPSTAWGAALPTASAPSASIKERRSAMKPNEVADVLDKAADAMWIYGRCSDGQSLAPSGAMCVRGAILYSLGLDPAQGMGLPQDAATVDKALGRYLAEHHDDLGAGCVQAHPDWAYGPAYPAWVWNDRTDDDAHVIDTIRRCAKAYRNGELEVA